MLLPFQTVGSEVLFFGLSSYVFLFFGDIVQRIARLPIRDDFFAKSSVIAIGNDWYGMKNTRKR